MPGVLIRTLQRQTQTIIGGGNPLLLIRGIDVSSFREATLLWRFHPGTSVPTAGTTVTVNVYSEAPSPEDPANDYVEVLNTTLAPSPIATVTITFPASSTGLFGPLMLRLPISTQNIGSTLRMTIGTASAVNITLVFSADISCKS